MALEVIKYKCCGKIYAASKDHVSLRAPGKNNIRLEQFFNRPNIKVIKI